MHLRTVRRHIHKEFNTTPRPWLDRLRMKVGRRL